MKGGFRFRNVEDEEVVRTAAVAAGSLEPGTIVEQIYAKNQDRDSASGSIKKSGKDEMMEKTM